MARVSLTTTRYMNFDDVLWADCRTMHQGQGNPDHLMEFASDYLRCASELGAREMAKLLPCCGRAVNPVPLEEIEPSATVGEETTGAGSTTLHPRIVLRRGTMRPLLTNGLSRSSSDLMLTNGPSNSSGFMHMDGRRRELEAADDLWMVSIEIPGSKGSRFYRAVMAQVQ